MPLLHAGSIGPLSSCFTYICEIVTVEPTLSESFRERHMWTAPKCATTALLKAIQERFLMFAPFYECRVKDKFPSQKAHSRIFSLA